MRSPNKGQVEPAIHSNPGDLRPKKGLQAGHYLMREERLARMSDERVPVELKCVSLHASTVFGESC